MTKHKGLLKVIDTGRLRATRSFRDEYGATFGRAGHDLSQSFKDKKALIRATLDTLDDDACDALADALGLLKEEEGGD